MKLRQILILLMANACIVALNLISQPAQAQNRQELTKSAASPSSSGLPILSFQGLSAQASANNYQKFLGKWILDDDKNPGDYIEISHHHGQIKVTIMRPGLGVPFDEPGIISGSEIEISSWTAGRCGPGDCKARFSVSADGKTSELTIIYSRHHGTFSWGKYTLAGNSSLSSSGNIAGQWSYSADAFGGECAPRGESHQSTVTITQTGNQFSATGGLSYSGRGTQHDAIGSGTISGTTLQSSDKDKIVSWSGTLSADGQTIQGKATCQMGGGGTGRGEFSFTMKRTQASGSAGQPPSSSPSQESDIAEPEPFIQEQFEPAQPTSNGDSPLW
jgi:hypothetical protein